VNLINNAIKFSKDGRTIYVTAKLLKHRSQPAEVEFQVIDEGPGIPEEKIDTIFDKFTQVGTGSEGERTGSGLGLAICKALVQAHKGRIGVTSTVGEGTAFWFRIPQSTSEESRNKASAS
jgi:signal transduction histidine kinase